MNIDRKEIRRYLGYGKNLPDDTVSKMIEECIEELNKNSTMRNIYQVFDLKILENNTLDFAGFQVQSRNLTKNLAECSQIILFAATLGTAADILIRKYSKMQMSRAVVMQAVTAAMIEEYCDKCQEEIRQKMEQKGLYLRPRFSPGYGDFKLEHQKDMIHVLECPKKIGLTLTESFILAPSKSVTAVIGLSQKAQGCHKKGCEECKKKNCQFRRGE